MEEDRSPQERLSKSLVHDFPEGVRENGKLILALSTVFVALVLVGALASTMDLVLTADAEGSIEALDSGRIPNSLKNRLVEEGISVGENSSLTVLENGGSWSLETENEIVRIVENDGELQVYRTEKNVVNRMAREVFGYFRESLPEDVPENPFGFTFYVLQNNIIVSVVGSIGAGVALGIEPLGVLLINALLSGYVVAVSLSFVGSSSLELFSILLPHGVFEFPALILSITCGVRLGIGAFRGLRAGGSQPLDHAGDSVLKMIPGILLLFVIAGFVEGFISPIGGSVAHPVKILGSLAAFVYVVLWMTGSLRNASR